MTNFARVFPLVSQFLSAVSRILGFVLAYFKGRGDERAKSTEKTLEAIRKAKDVARRVDSDPEFLERVREYYRRK